MCVCVEWKAPSAYKISFLTLEACKSSGPTSFHPLLVTSLHTTVLLETFPSMKRFILGVTRQYLCAGISHNSFSFAATRKLPAECVSSQFLALSSYIFFSRRKNDRFALQIFASTSFQSDQILWCQKTKRRRRKNGPICMSQGHFSAKAKGSKADSLTPPGKLCQSTRSGHCA